MPSGEAFMGDVPVVATDMELVTVEMSPRRTSLQLSVLIEGPI